jgi:hypothetical protein
MRQVVHHASERHFRVEFCPEKLLKQPHGLQNYTISESNMQRYVNEAGFGSFMAHSIIRQFKGRPQAGKQ